MAEQGDGCEDSRRASVDHLAGVPGGAGSERHDPIPVLDPRARADKPWLEHIAGLCKLRYGEAPHFVVKGKFVKGTLTPSIQAQQEARIAAEGTNGIATDVIVVVFDDGEVCKQALCLRQRTHLLFAASLEWT